jgi:hypothetical protein
MSETASIAAVGPGHWTFMATLMATRLESFIQRKEVISDEIPEGVYSGVKEFFDLVLAAAGDKRPTSPPASVNAYVIATDALRGSLKPFPETSQDLLAKLDEYAAFVNDLNHTHSIADAKQLEIATSLRDFFRSLAQDGEAELYMQTIQANHTSPGFPFIR